MLDDGDLKIIRRQTGTKNLFLFFFFQINRYDLYRIGYDQSTPFPSQRLSTTLSL